MVKQHRKMIKEPQKRHLYSLNGRPGNIAIHIRYFSVRPGFKLRKVESYYIFSLSTIGWLRLINW